MQRPNLNNEQEVVNKPYGSKIKISTVIPVDITDVSEVITDEL